MTLSDWLDRSIEDPSDKGRLLELWNGRPAADASAVAAVPLSVNLRDRRGTVRETLVSPVWFEGSMLLAVSDITALRLAETELRSMRRKLEETAYELTENIPVGTYTMVLEKGSVFARFSFISRRFLELTGLDRATVLEDPLRAFDCVHPDDREEWIRGSAEAFECGVTFKREARIVANGRQRRMIAESTPRSLPDGSVVWEGVLTDITERRMAEERLASRESELTTILENLPVPIAINELGGNPAITFLNRSFQRVFGYAARELPTLEDWAVRAYPDPGYRHEVMNSWAGALADAALQDGVVDPREYKVRCADGSFKDVLINAVVLERILVVGFVDITESKREAERRRLLEEAHRKQLETKLKSSLAAAAVAHEINQPLSVILLTGRIAMLEEGSERAALERIVSKAGRVAVTIEKMKALLRNVETAHQLLSLAAVVRSSVTYNHPLFLRSRVEVVVSSPADLPPVLGDEVQLQIAITNILRNAVEAIGQAAPEKGIISVDLRDGGDSVELAIGDNGTGWSGIQLDDEPLCSDKPDGTGIGLFIVRTTMRNHRGSIAFGRSASGGAEIRLSFPRCPRDAEESAQPPFGEMQES